MSSAVPPGVPPGSTPLRGHIPALDGLRGIAILLVMLTHFANYDYAGAALLLLFARTGLKWGSFAMQAAGYSALGVFFGALRLRAVGATPGSRTARLFAHPWLRFFGKYSYGIYVVHLLMADLLRDIVLRRWRGPTILGSGMIGQPLFTVMAGAASVAAALLSWELVEHPFLKLKDRFTYAPRSRPAGRANAPGATSGAASA